MRDDRVVEVSKERLLETLLINLKEHCDQVIQAKVVYQVAAIEVLRQRTADLINGKEVDLHFDLRRPVSYAKEIEQAISRVEWTLGDSIMLTEQEFKQWVLGEWAWRRQYAAATMSYLEK